MKPYGRLRNIKGCGKWKVDRHPRPKKDFVNWWEDEFDNTIPRTSIKQLIRKEVEEELYGNQ